jgi:hypothetical protein
MAQLDFQPGDERWKRLRKRAVNDLEWFCDVVLGYGPLIPMKPSVHRVFCRLLERRTGHPALDDAPVRLFLMPRETGKTTIGTQGAQIQSLCRDPDRSFLICNEKEANAAKFLMAIKGEFESNELLRALFPEVIPPDFGKVRWSATEMDVARTTRRKEPSCWVTGTGGTVTGMHPDEVICDDIISLDAMQNAKTGARQVLNAVNDWTHTLWPLVNKNAPRHGITFIGTHWLAQDCYDHVAEYFGHGEPTTTYTIRCPMDDGTVQTLTASRTGDIAVFVRSAVEDGRSIFPEKWTLEQLAQMRIADPVLFAANYMNKPSDELTSDFKESWLKVYQWTDTDAVQFVDPVGKTRSHLLGDLDRIVLVDPGGFGTIVTGDRMRAAMILTGTTPDGLILGLRNYCEKDSYLTAIRIAVDWGRRYRPRKFVVEQTAQQQAFLELLRRELAAAGVLSTVEPITPRNQAKEQRILELEPFFQQGRVYIGTGSEWMEFRQQYSQFPRAARRDLLDALAYGPVVWRKTPLAASSHEARQRRELDQLAQKRQATLQWRR